MSWMLSIWVAAAALLALCRGQNTVHEGNSLYASGYHLCVHNVTRNVSFPMMHTVSYTTTKRCGSWPSWQTCTVTLYKMTLQTEYKTVMEQVTTCCDGYVQVGHYCALPVNRSVEFTAKPGSCPTADGLCPRSKDCEWDMDCPGWQKCCQGSGRFVCSDPASPANYSENGGCRLNVTVTVKTDHQQLMSSDGGHLSHTRLLQAMVTGALQSDVSVHYLSSQPVHPYRTATSLLIANNCPLPLNNITSKLHLLLKHIQEVSFVSVEDVDECAEPALRQCSPQADCNNTLSSYRCTCQQGYTDVDPSNPGAHCTASSSTQHPPTRSAPHCSMSSTVEPPLLTTTCSPPSITSIWSANVTGTAFCVYWSSQFQTNQTYQVVVRNRSEVINSSVTDQTMMEMTKLKPGVLYNVTVTPSSCGGQGVALHISVKTDAQTLDATTRLTNIQFTADLHNTSSQAYKNLTDSIKKEVYQSLSPEMKAMMDSDQVRIEIRGFSPGSVVVNFSIISSPSQSQDITNVSKALLHSLMNSTEYTVDENNTSTNDFNECDSGENDCSQWANCTNIWASYTCGCLDGFIDNNPERPGRACQAITTTTTAPTTTTSAPAITTTTPTTIITASAFTTTALTTTPSAPSTTAAPATTTTTPTTSITVPAITTTVPTTTTAAPVTTDTASTTTPTAPTTTTTTQTTVITLPAITTTVPTTTTAAPVTTDTASTTTPTAPTTTTTTQTTVITLPAITTTVPTTTTNIASTTTPTAPTTTTTAPTTTDTVPTTTTTAPTTTDIASTTTSTAPTTTTTTQTAIITVPAFTTSVPTTTTTTAPATTATAPTTTTTAPTTTDTASTTTPTAPTTTTTTPQTTIITAPAITTTVPTTIITASTTTITAPTTTTTALTTTPSAPTTTTTAPTTIITASTTTITAPTTTTTALTTTPSAPTTNTTDPTTINTFTTTTTTAPATITTTSTTTTTVPTTIITSPVPTTIPTAPTSTTMASTTITTAPAITTTVPTTTDPTTTTAAPMTTTSAATTTTLTSTTTAMTSMTSTPTTTITVPTTTATAPRAAINTLTLGAISVQCRVPAITVIVAKDFLQSNNIRESTLYLGLPECVVNGDNATHIQMTVAWDECGTSVMQNETFYTVAVTLFNTMELFQSANGTVEGPRIQLESPIMCTYSKHILLSANSGSMGYDMIKDLIVGSGFFQVTVQLMNGTMPLPHNYSLSSEEAVVVDVSLNTSSEQIKVVINKCWGTPTQNPLDIDSYPFLENSCSLNTFTEVLMNGKSSTSRVSVRIFSFVNLDMIYLHCQVQICVQMVGSDTCVPDCLQRTSRSSRTIGTASGTSGPLLRLDMGFFEEEYTTLQIVGFSCLGIGLSLFFIIGFVCVFYYQRNRIGHYNFSNKPKQENFTYLVFNT